MCYEESTLVSNQIDIEMEEDGRPKTEDTMIMILSNKQVTN
jgi:hypothetical protein